MAIDIHSISAMSAEPERVFSGVKHTISDQRNSLKSETIEWLECLKSWFRLGLFTGQDLYAIVGQLNEEGAMEALETMNQEPLVSLKWDRSKPLDGRFGPLGALGQEQSMTALGGKLRQSGESPHMFA